MNEPDARPSKKQRELLTFIEGFIAAHGYGPSYREIMQALHYKSVSTVAVHIDNLIMKGHLVKRDKSARSLEVVAGGPIKPIAPMAVKQVAKSQEKWLVDAIATKFTEAEQHAQQTAELDSLYVLVGALHILGLDDAARAYQSRLLQLKRRMAK